jgi:type I restriction enzyme S subunit
MTTFQKVKLGDVIIKIIGGGTPSKNNLKYWNGSLPWASVKDLHDNKYYLDSTEDFITEEGLKNSASNLIKKGTVILPTRMGLGRVVKTRIDTTINQDLKALIPNEKINNDFLLWILIYSGKKLQTLGNGSTVSGIRLEDLKNIKIDLPDLPTQTRIASVLSAYDDLIENNEKRIKALEEMARLLYIEWFVKFKFLGHEKVKMVNSELGKIPEGWGVGKISDLVNIVSGFSFKGSTYQESGKYKIVTIKNVHDSRFVLNFDSFIDKLPSKLPIACILKNGDILLSLTGNVGRICVVYGQNHVLNQRVAKLDPVNKNNREFIYLLFRQKRFQQKLEAMSNGAAQQNLSPIQVKGIKVLIPNSEILDKFSQFVGKYFDLSLSLQQKNQELSQIRDLLIPQLVTGKRELE